MFYAGQAYHIAGIMLRDSRDPLTLTLSFKLSAYSDSDVSAKELLHREDVKNTKRLIAARRESGPPAIGDWGRWQPGEISRVSQEPTGLSKPKKNGSELVALTR